MNFRSLQKLATVVAALAAIFLASIVVTGGYGVHLAGLKFEANKLWPAIVAILGFAILRLIFGYGSIRGAISARPGLVIFCVALIVFLANGRTISGGDSVPAKNLPLSILRYRNFYLDRLVAPDAKKIPYFLRESDGHYVSDYPVGAALLALPFYVPSVVCGVRADSRIFSELEKISAATIVALSVVLIYLAAALVTESWMATLLTVIYAFGTSSLSVSSQALWQHGPAQLALAAAIYCLIRARGDPRWAGYAGLPLAFEVMTRPVDALIAAPLGLYVLLSYRHELWIFLAGAALPLLFEIWYSATYFGTPYRIQFFTQPPSAGGQALPAGGFWATPIHQGLATVVMSPGRGLFFYSPIFVLSFVGLAFSWRKNGDPLLRYLGVGAILSILVVAKWHRTSGGASFGPRLLADLAPILALALFPLADALRNRRAIATVFAILAAWSITANSFGAFINYRAWNNWALGDPETRLWLWSDNPVVDPFRWTFDSIRIAAGHLATSRNSPDLLEAGISVRTPTPLVAAPGAPVHVSLHAINVGKAVWLASRSSEENGAVSLGWNWVRGDKAVEEGEARRELHLSVFPGESIDLEASSIAPDAPGRYQLAISLYSTTAADRSRPIGAPLIVPVTIEISGTAPGARR